MTKRNTRKPKTHYKSVVRLACLLILGPTMFSVGMGDSGSAGSQESQEEEWFRKGNEFFEKKDFLEALVWFRKAYDITSNVPNSPSRVAASYRIWQCYEKLGDAEKAEKWKRLAEGKTEIVDDLAKKTKALSPPPTPSNGEVKPVAKSDGNSLKATPIVNPTPEPAKISNAQNKPIVAVELRVLPFDGGNNPYAPMMNAIQNGDINKVDELLSKGFDINTIMCLNLRRPMRYNTLLKKMDPSRANPNPSKIDTIQQERILQSRPNDNIWMVTGSGNWRFKDQTDWQEWNSSIWIAGSPLMYACWFRNPEMVKHLLEKGANPNVWIKFKCRSVKDNFSRPWLSACHYLSMLMCGTDTWKRDASKIAEINKMLLDAGLRFPDKEDGYFKKTDDFGRTALWDAFETLDPFWLKVLLEQKKYDPKEKDGGGASFVEFLEKIDSNFGNNEFALGKVQEMKELLEKYGYKEHGKNESGSGGYKFIEVE